MPNKAQKQIKNENKNQHIVAMCLFFNLKHILLFQSFNIFTIQFECDWILKSV